MQFNDYKFGGGVGGLLSNKTTNDPSLKSSKNTSCERKNIVSKATSSSFLKNKQNQQCTFEPKINNTGATKRSFNKFIKDQQMFLLTKQQKIQHLRQQINKTNDKENTRKPSLGYNPNLISRSSQNHNVDSIFQRLFKEKHVQVFNNAECYFSPKILDRSKSLTRTMDISNLLYEDARRRQQKQHFLESKQVSAMGSPKINSNTNQLVSRKILTQFSELVSDEEMNPLIAISILQQIFNVDLNPNKNAGNNLTVQKLLGYIAEPNRSNSATVSSGKLGAFISTAIGGVSKMKCFTEYQQQKIFQDFNYLYKERITKQKKNSCPDILTFKPQTLVRSNKLAESYREKTCQQIDSFLETQKINISLKDGNYTIEDLFILDHLKRQSENQKKKIQRQNEELEKCTFKPEISTSAFSTNAVKKKAKVTLKVPVKHRQSKIKTQQTQCLQSQNNNLNKLQQTKTNPSQRKEVGTNQISVKVSRCKSNKNIKDIEKAVMRMSVGRQQRQLSVTVMQRGYPKGENWTVLQRQMHQQSIQNNKRLKGLMCR